jgi:hypothetical protein
MLYRHYGRRDWGPLHMKFLREAMKLSPKHLLPLTLTLIISEKPSCLEEKENNERMVR